MLLEALIRSVAAPFVIALLVFAGMAALRWVGLTGAAGRAYLPAVALAYAATHVLLRGIPPFPARETLDWLPLFGILAALLGFAESLGSKPGRWRWPARLILVAVFLWAMANPLIKYSWSALQAAAWMAGLEIAWLLWWGAVDRQVRREERRLVPLHFLIVGAGGSIALLLSNSALLGQIAGAIVPVLAAWLLLAVCHVAPEPSRGAGAALAVLLIAPWLLGRFYADLPFVSLLALCLTPLAAAAGSWLRRRGVAPGWKIYTAEILITLLIVALAVAPPLISSLSDQAETYY